MLHTTPTYEHRTEAFSMASEHLLCAIGGGNANCIISSDYSELYSLLRALYASVGSRLFRVYTSINKLIISRPLKRL